MSRRIAVIGLGNMGGPMAANLVKAGHTVTGFDVSEAALAAATDAGVAVRPSAAEAVADAEVVLTMLPNGALVLGAYDELLPVAAPDTLFIDSSTISVADAREAAARAHAAGHRAIDAPVSGGVGGATAGTLTFMVGGSDADVADAGDVLEPMAGRVVHCGPAGAGQSVKVCNNLILAIHMIGVSEAFVLAEELGLSHQALFDVSSTATGQCWALNVNCPVPGPVPTSPANRDYAPGFASALMAKDLGLAMDAVHSTGVGARLGELAERIYRDFAAGEGGSRDFSAVIADVRAHSTDRAGTDAGSDPTPDATKGRSS
ncbi:3-hydroxyisobutyrate dehydrogenase [Agilicoccus flavus]|uniref:3-hydroxyisobutyrate dehydrogenase n=1 Tax=Agilicoccus flavus TaxID=2775968 RepID=UPI001CF6EE20|nr:3-hydroxyisobutyrate dehydrogenase [Agilicoccus flavus]